MTDLSTHPTQPASAWFADFQSALERQDIDAVMALFDADRRWPLWIAIYGPEADGPEWPVSGCKSLGLMKIGRYALKLLCG